MQHQDALPLCRYHAELGDVRSCSIKKKLLSISVKYMVIYILKHGCSFTFRNQQWKSIIKQNPLVLTSGIDVLAANLSERGWKLNKNISVFKLQPPWQEGGNSFSSLLCEKGVAKCDATLWDTGGGQGHWCHIASDCISLGHSPAKKFIIRKKFLPLRVVRHCHRFPRKAVANPSLEVGWAWSNLV